MATSEPTSCYFVAHLGSLDAAILERLDRWAAAACSTHALKPREDGSMALYAVKKGGSAKTARQFQSLLRTLTSHWKMPFGKLERGWLKLLSVEEYRAAVGDPLARANLEAALPAPEQAPSKDQTQALRGLPQLCSAEAAETVFLTRLSDDFATRSQQALARLRAARLRAAC